MTCKTIYNVCVCVSYITCKTIYNVRVCICVYVCVLYEVVSGYHYIK